MLVVRCANGHVTWVFRRTTPDAREARCLQDGFKLSYSPTPGPEWEALIQGIVQHSVGLRGAFGMMFYVPVV